MTDILMDTSVAVPLLLTNHPDHAHVAAWAKGKRLAFAGHALFETYAVLTRLPAESRLTPDQACRLIDQYPPAEHQLNMPSRDAIRLMAGHGIAGGQVYDALVALAAKNDKLATRDRRALELYNKLGIDVETI